jgi:hypothetical protein
LRLYLKKTHHTELVEVVHYLPSKCAALSSNPSTAKTINQKKKKKPSQKRAGGVAQGLGPGFKPQYRKNK